MRANDLVELVRNNETNIKNIKGYADRIRYIENLCHERDSQTKLQRMRKSALESIVSAMSFMIEDKESDIVLASLKKDQDENSFYYKEDGFDTDMLIECRNAVRIIRNICLDD